MKLHELKCWPDGFAQIVDGGKRWELRHNDRGFEVGDLLQLREWKPMPATPQQQEPGIYTGNEQLVRIIDVWPAERFAPFGNPLLVGWVVLSIEHVGIFSWADLLSEQKTWGFSERPAAPLDPQADLLKRAPRGKQEAG